MKRIVFAAAVVGLAVTGTAGVATAEGTTTTMSAHYYHRHHNHGVRHHYGWRNHYAYAGCQIVVRHRINRWGEPVVVRKRICY